MATRKSSSKSKQKTPKAAELKPKASVLRPSKTEKPLNEYLALSDLKLRSIRMGRPAKKSEVLRAGIAALSKMSDAEFFEALDAIPSLKTGRPKEAKKATVEKTSVSKKN